MSLTLSIARGTILGGQPVTITGESFGAAQGIVTLEGRTCTVASWIDSAITIETPSRRTNGLLVLEVGMTDAGDIAPIPGALVVTLADGVTTYTADYTYLVTLWDIALQEIRSSVASTSRAAGDNYDIASSQIRDYKTGDDGSNRGAGYPQITMYGGEIRYTYPDQPYEHDTGEMDFILAATQPVTHPENWDAELRALGRDLARKVRLARLTSKVAHQIQVDTIDPMAKPKDGQVTGATGTVILAGKIFIEHMSINMNTNTGA